MGVVSMKQLLEAGVHFGHHTRRWNPKMAEYIFTERNGIYIIDLQKTVKKLNEAYMFVRDIAADGGDILFRESRHLLKSDMVQMAHHGHMNVSMEVYAEIMPEACLWCAPEWLYEEEEVPKYLADADRLIRMGRVRMYGTAVTRKWMELLGVKTHYVSGWGTNCIEL